MSGISFGTLLREHRLAASLSQEALAERSRMSVDAISALERGARRAPRRDTVALLVDALRLDGADRARFEAAAAEARPTGVRAGPSAVDHNLPLPLTTFYGRAGELDHLTRELSDHRCVTLAGFAGVGKTRLAIEAARTLLPRFADGVFMVELAPLGDPESVVSRTAAVLGLPAQTGQLGGDLWIDALREKSALLLLDNCEHVLDAAGALAQRLLQRCPQFRVLATSREPLRVPGERVVRIAPLAVPLDGYDRLAPGAVRDAPAVALFLARVGDAAPEFELADDDATGWETVRTVCARLDGIPLALELAAARVPALGLGALERALDDRFRLLTGGARTSLPRQKTLQATLDWSYAMLAEPEQRVFDRLGVFAATFTAEAARAVCAADGVEESDVVEILSSLVDKSLVVADGVSTKRYRLLDTTRAYALQRAAAAGDLEPSRRRHAEYYHELSSRVRASFGRRSFAEWAETYGVERDNFRAALAWAIDARGDVARGAAILSNLNRLFEWLMLNAEVLTWCEHVFAALDVDASPLVEADLRTIVTRHHIALGSYYAAIAPAQRAVALYRLAGAELQRAQVLTFLARALSTQPGGREPADRVLNEALAIYAAAESRAPLEARSDEEEIRRAFMTAMARSFKAFTLEPSELARRRALLSEAIECYRMLSPGHYIIGVTRVNLSELEIEAREYERAGEHAQAAIEFYRRPGSAFGYIWALNAAGTAALARGNLGAARASASELLSLARRMGSAPGLGMALLLLAGVEAMAGDPVCAAGLLGAWETCAGKIDTPAATTELLRGRAQERLSAALGEAELARALGAGTAWTLEEAIDIALIVAEGWSGPSREPPAR